MLAFDRAALRVCRAGALGGLDRAMAGCIDASVEPAAVVPWRDVRDIEAGAGW